MSARIPRIDPILQRTYAQTFGPKNEIENGAPEEYILSTAQPALLLDALVTVASYERNLQ